MKGGYTGKILRLDLNRLDYSLEKPDGDTLEKFIGGEGMGIKYLYERVSPGADALGPENPLIFMTGPMTGTLAPASGRHCVVTKSPLTGCQVSSHAGGYWGSELKFAGYDGIIVEGQSDKPVYVFIDDDDVHFYDAKGLWGKDVIQTDNLIKEQLGDSELKAAYIGPAGENLIKYASILNDQQRSASRGGTGAVMGSKRLKAIVVRGTHDINAADPAKYFASMNELLNTCYDHYITGSLFPAYGITGIMGRMNEAGVLPTMNHYTGNFSKADDISGQKMAETMLKKTRGCFCCTIHCTRVIDIKYGPYHGTRGKGPDYEAAVAFGSQCGNGNLEAIAKANLLCDQYGLDPVSTGDAIAWAMELYEHGIITDDDTHGVHLSFGDHEAMTSMIPKIATRAEFGAVLAEGPEEAARKIGRGSEKYLQTVKGLPLPGIEARGSKGAALGYATDNRGGDDLRPFASMAECLGYRSKELGMPDKFDPLSELDKVRWMVPCQNYFTAVNSLVVCMFTAIAFTVEPSQYARHLTALTGIEYDQYKLMEAGERAWNLQRAFNAREGFSRADDRLPYRLTSELLPNGPNRGSVVHIEQMLDDYYAAREWNKDTGWPTRRKLEALGLGYVAKDLEKPKQSSKEAFAR